MSDIDLALLNLNQIASGPISDPIEPPLEQQTARVEQSGKVLEAINSVSKFGRLKAAELGVMGDG